MTVNTAWEMTETHLGIDGGIIKNRSGNPKVGKFTAGGISGGVDHDPAETEYEYEIPLTALGLTVDTVIEIAAHTAIEYLEDGILYEESAWGQGTSFNENSKKNWAMSIEYTVVIP